MPTPPLLETLPAPQPPPTRPRAARRGEPTWAMAKLFPAQGYWSEKRYLASNFDNHRVEYVNGFVEFLSMPTLMHQLILQFFYEQLRAYTGPSNLGLVVVSGLRVKLEPEGEKQYRQPDVVFMRHDPDRRHRMGNEFWEGADLAVEIVSPDDPKRDLEEKRTDYARGGIPEYWIVDPRSKEVHVLTLKVAAPRQAGGYVDDAYDLRGTYRPGDTATSALLEGFAVDVTVAFEAGKAGE